MTTPQKQLCPRCGGEGIDYSRDITHLVSPIVATVCPTCHGTGQLPAAEGEAKWVSDEDPEYLKALLNPETQRGNIEGMRIVATPDEQPKQQQLEEAFERGRRAEWELHHTTPADEQPNRTVVVHGTTVHYLDEACEFCDTADNSHEEPPKVDHPAPPSSPDSELDRIEEAFNQGRTADACNLIEALIQAARVEELKLANAWSLTSSLSTASSRKWQNYHTCRLKALKEGTK